MPPFESNGKHHFVETAASLPAAFDSEAQVASTIVATGAEAVIELAPGVELQKIVARTGTRVGNPMFV